MDEILIFFDLLSNIIIDHKDTKTVTIHITGYEYSSFTIILACMADDSKFPAVCIFKLKNLPKEKFPHSIHIRVNKKG